MFLDIHDDMMELQRITDPVSLFDFNVGELYIPHMPQTYISPLHSFVFTQFF